MRRRGFCAKGTNFLPFGRNQVRQPKDFRPPNLPRRQAFWLLKLPPKRDFRLCVGLSAAEARVEGSICNAYLVEEAAAFSAHYFEAHVMTRHRKVPRNLPEFVFDDDVQGKLSIFKCTGRTIGKEKSRYMTEDEIRAAQTYILLNCPEVKTYIDIYVERVKSIQPNITDAAVDEKLEREFGQWFYKYVHDLQNNVDNQFIQDLSNGPLRSVTTFDGYCVNGCKLNTIKGNSSSNSMNFGVCIKGSNYSSKESDYYGQLVEVLRLEYPGLPIKWTVLFKCDWFDPTPNMGIKVDRQYIIVYVNNKRTSQATQVVYASYPSKRHDKNDWWAVMKVKGRPIVEVSDTSSKTDEPFQEDEIDYAELNLDDVTEQHCLNDSCGGMIEIHDDVSTDEDKFLSDPDSDADIDGDNKFDSYESE
ncbi:hypothetical protein MANES_13G071916v8 [Manihot esculenta]|uniref:Uncharacterized protein n=1 Tax=Manihot esculenta TaxID=3983 RepID=A0ACB7GLL2_MANES|nr:hypothetical protein MANES_13G071916v8 [Manihot esculenta]